LAGVERGSRELNHVVSYCGHDKPTSLAMPRKHQDTTITLVPLSFEEATKAANPAASQTFRELNLKSNSFKYEAK